LVLLSKTFYEPGFAIGVSIPKSRDKVYPTEAMTDL
jgi:hypothetical protein